MLTQSHTLPQTIDEVIAQLEQVLERCLREDNRLGYFAMLYRDVTVRVREGIGMEQARNLAWLTAQEMANLTGEELSQKIQETDQIVAALGHVILSPIGILTRLGLHIIRLRETRRVSQVIQILKFG